MFLRSASQIYIILFMSTAV